MKTTETTQTDATLISKLGLWCEPTGCGGGTLRTVARQGVPLSFGFLAGMMAHIGLHHLLQEEPKIFELGISVLVGLATALTTVVLVHQLLECCWHERYQDNYRELSKNDIESVCPQGQYHTFTNKPDDETRNSCGNGKK
jgi:hypothetical protein